MQEVAIDARKDVDSYVEDSKQDIRRSRCKRAVFNEFIIEIQNRSSHLILRNIWYNLKGELHDFAETIMRKVECREILDHLQLNVVEECY